MSLGAFLLVTIASGVAVSVQRAVGIGATFIAGPVVVLIDPGFIPVPLLIVSCLPSTLILLQDWNAVPETGIISIGWGLLPGLALGVAVLTVASQAALMIFLGALVIVGSLWMHFAPASAPLTSKQQAAGGVVAGICAGSVGAGGPTLALLCAHWPGRQMRAAVSVLSLLCCAIVIPVLFLLGRVGRHEMILTASLLPGAGLGLLLGGLLAARLEPRLIRNAALAVSAAAGLLLLAQPLLG